MNAPSDYHQPVLEALCAFVRDGTIGIRGGGAVEFRGHPEVVDADLADYFGSIPHTDLLRSIPRLTFKRLSR